MEEDSAHGADEGPGQPTGVAVGQEIPAPPEVGPPMAAEYPLNDAEVSSTNATNTPTESEVVTTDDDGVAQTNVLLQTGNCFVMTTGADLLAQAKQQEDGAGAAEPEDAAQGGSKTDRPGRRPKSAVAVRAPGSAPGSHKRRPKSASAAQAAGNKSKARLSFSATFKPPPGVPDSFTSESGRNAYEAFVEQKRLEQQKQKKNKQSVAELQARRVEDERRAEEAYRAWKQSKEAELARLREQKARTKKRELDESTRFKAQKTQQFNEWLETKKLNQKQVKTSRKQEQGYFDHVKIQQEQRKSSDEAFRLWMAKKREAKRSEKERERERRKQLVLEARYLKKRMQERLAESPPQYTL